MDARKETVLKHRLFRKPSKRIQVFIISLLISAFIWFVREITKEGFTTIKIPVTIENLNPDLIITSDIPEHIEVDISSFGIDRIKTELYQNQKPVVIDLSDKQPAGTEQITTAKLISWLRKSLGNKIDINSTIPSQFNISIEKIASKKVKILPKVNISYAEGFFLEQELMCKPDSILIEGAQSSLDTINYVYTDLIEANNLDKSLQSDVACVLGKGIRATTINTSIHIIIDEYTEGFLYKKLPLELFENRAKISYFPDSIKVSFQVGLNRYEDVKSEEFILEIGEINPDIEKCEVKIKTFPEYVKNIRLFPSRVEYYISEPN